MAGGIVSISVSFPPVAAAVADGNASNAHQIELKAFGCAHGKAPFIPARVSSSSSFRDLRRLDIFESRGPGPFDPLPRLAFHPEPLSRNGLQRPKTPKVSEMIFASLWRSFGPSSSSALGSAGPSEAVNHAQGEDVPAKAGQRGPAPAGRGLGTSS